MARFTGRARPTSGVLHRQQDGALGKGGWRPLFEETSAPPFTAVIPADNPRYELLVLLDEPQPLKETFGWNVLPTGGKVIARIAPLLGVEPRFDQPPSDRIFVDTART